MRQLRPRIVHKAKHVNDKGGVSPVCADKPRAISLKVASWSLVWRFVTCKKCLKRRPGEAPRP